MEKRKPIQQKLLGKLDICMQINETRTHPHTVNQINSKCLKDLNIRQNTIKLLEENIGKTFSGINLMNIFSGQSPKATEIKAKINRWEQYRQPNRNMGKRIKQILHKRKS